MRQKMLQQILNHLNFKSRFLNNTNKTGTLNVENT